MKRKRQRKLKCIRILSMIIILGWLLSILTLKLYVNASDGSEIVIFKYDKEVSVDSISIKNLKNNTYLFEIFHTYTLNSIQWNRERKEKNPLKYQSLEEINIMSTAENFELLYQVALYTQSPIKYYDMHHVVDEALKCVKEELGDL